MQPSKQQVLYLYGGESYDNYEAFLERLRTKDIWDLPSSEVKGKWTNTLASDLGEDFEVFMPVMPNKQNAKYEEWKIWFERHFEHLHDEAILVGCSLGAMFLTKYLAENDTPFSIKSLIIMACPVKEEGFDDEESGSFRFENDVIPKLSGKAEEIIIMHSRDDFLVPYRHAVKYQELLPEAKLITFTDKNHFLVAKLPELVEKIKEISA